MSEPKPFRVEVVINAPREDVWRALTEPDRIRQWFGWDYDGLDDEIRLIFSDGATPLPPGRIDLGAGQWIELEPDGPRVIVRAIMPGPLDDAEWDDIYDGMEEGWRTFFEQLRFMLEVRPAGRRRTLYLTGTAPGPRAVAALDEVVPKQVWHESRRQRMIVDRDGHLLALASQRPLTVATPAPLSLTVTTYGLDDAALAALGDEWAARWEPFAQT